MAKTTIVILFLAHQGVINPVVWESWREHTLAHCSRTNKILFRVHAPLLGQASLDNFTSKYALRDPATKAKIPFGKTGWCDPSLVWQCLRALDNIIIDPEIVEPGAKIKICLVSGMDVPCKNGAFMFSADFVNMDSPCIHPSGNTHSQWISLTLDSAIKLVGKFYNDKRAFARLFREYLDGTVRSCPDEHWLLSWKDSSTFTDPDDCTTMDLLRPKGPLSPSPCEWDSLERCVDLNIKDHRYCWDLTKALLFVSVYVHNLYSFSFRKVMVDCSPFLETLFIPVLWNRELTWKERCELFNTYHPDGMRLYITPSSRFPIIINHRKRDFQIRQKNPRWQTRQKNRQELKGRVSQETSPDLLAEQDFNFQTVLKRLQQQVL